MAACKVCGALIEFVPLVAPARPTRPHPVDPGEVWPAMVGLVAVNPATGKGLVVDGEHLSSGDVERWTAQGVVFRRSHFATCAAAQSVRDGVLAGQEQLF